MTMPDRRGQNLWIDTDDGFVGATWYWPSQCRARSTVVLLVPGIAHEERAMSGGLVALAEALADRGLPALLMDLYGCSQSAGRIEDPDIGLRWRAGIRAAFGHARATGAARVVVVGARLGVPRAVDALAGERLAALVAWAPIVSGKRYVRELKVLQRTSEPEAGAIAIGGFSIPASVIDHISALDLATIESLDAGCVMLREMTEALNAPWLARLRGRGMLVQEQVSTQIHPWLFGDGDQPVLPYEDIQALSSWCRAFHDQVAGDGELSPLKPAPRPVVEFVHRGQAIRETFVEIGSSKLTGVLSEPVSTAGQHPARLLMSTVGPGRTFADFARDEASRGRTSLRFDFAGFGTSGRGNSVQGGELYTDEGSQDVQAAIQYLRQIGHRDIYGLGFCAGAWSMLQGALTSDLQAAVAINVALYRQPAPAAPSLARKAGRRLLRRVPVMARSRLIKKILARLRRKSTRRCEPVEWLIRLCNADTRVLLAFAERDPGLDYLNVQLAKGVHKQLRRPFTVQTYAGLGHLAEGPAARTRVFDEIADFFAGLDGEIASPARRQKKAFVKSRSPKARSNGKLASAQQR